MQNNKYFYKKLCKFMLTSLAFEVYTAILEMHVEVFLSFVLFG